MLEKNKVRFQNPNFRQKLQQARGYRRPVRKIPETRLGIFLDHLGLNKLIVKILFFVLVLSLTYLIFAPNFLTIKKIEISGLNNETQTLALESVQTYLKSNPFWPRSNLFLLSPEKLQKHLLSGNKKIEGVEKIAKQYPSTLKINLKQRYDRFLLKNTRGELYTLSNDGIITRQLSQADFEQASSSLSTLVVFEILSDKVYYENQRVAPEDYFKNLDEFLGRAKNDVQLTIKKLSANNIETYLLETLTAEEFVVKFDLNSELAKTFEQLKLLLKDIGGARISSIKYIDMRIKDRGYICYKDAPCAQETENPKPATSTEESIIK